MIKKVFASFLFEPICCYFAIDTDWAGGIFKVVMEFSEDYPSKVNHRPAEFVLSFIIKFV